MPSSLPILLLGLGFGSLLGAGFWVMAFAQRKLGHTEDGKPKPGGQLSLLLVNGPLAAIMLYVLVHAARQLREDQGPQALGFASMVLACIGVPFLLGLASRRLLGSSGNARGQADEVQRHRSGRAVDHDDA